MFRRDDHYIVKDDKVVIIDEFTGRMMPGRRFSEGLHQALEAKEGVAIKPENVTLASVTFQNYFRLYNKLSGMTGTADTEAFELQQIYGLEVVVIPTHQPMIRDDAPDLVYLTEQDKFEAIIEDITDCRERGQCAAYPEDGRIIRLDFKRLIIRPAQGEAQGWLDGDLNAGLVHWLIKVDNDSAVKRQLFFWLR